MKKRDILLPMLLAFMALTGCNTIRDSYDDCLYITFDAVNPKHNYAAEVQNVSLYFYGPDDALAAERHYQRDQLRISDRAAMVSDIKSGTYRVLAVVNDGFQTQTEIYKNYGTATTHVKQNAASKRVLNEKMMPFFFSEREMVVNADRETVQIERMSLIKNNNTIYVHLIYEGFEAVEGTEIFAWIEGKNGRYTYSAPYSSTDALTSNYWSRTNTYGPDGSDEDALPDLTTVLTFSTMHMYHGDGLTLRLEERAANGAVVDLEELRYHNINITDYLKTVQDADGELIYDTDAKLQYNDEYHIHILLQDVVAPSAPPGYYYVITIGDWDKISTDIGV